MHTVCMPVRILNSAPKILLVKTYGNTFFIEGELWLFRWKFLIARWKEGAHSYTCMPLYGSKCSETSFVRYSNMSFDAIFLIFCCFLACLMYGNNCFQSFQHRTKTRMCSCEHLLSNALSNAFNERVKVLFRWKTCSHMSFITIFWAPFSSGTHTAPFGYGPHSSKSFQ